MECTAAIRNGWKQALKGVFRKPFTLFNYPSYKMMLPCSLIHLRMPAKLETEKCQRQI